MEDWKSPLIICTTVILCLAALPVACTVQERNRSNAIVDMVRAGADPMAAKCATTGALTNTTDSTTCLFVAARLNPTKEPK